VPESPGLGPELGQRKKGFAFLEQIILSAVWSLGNDAYGVAVRKKVKKLLGRNINCGTLYLVASESCRAL